MHSKILVKNHYLFGLISLMRKKTAVSIYCSLYFLISAKWQTWRLQVCFFSHYSIGQEAVGRKRCTEVPPEYEQEHLYCAGEAREQAAQRVCGVSLTGDIQDLSGHSSLPCALGWPSLSREVGPEDPLRSLPAWHILWLCDSFSQYPKPAFQTWCQKPETTAKIPFPMNISAANANRKPERKEEMHH